MKSKKILLGALSVCALSGLAAPIVTACACNKNQPKTDPNLIPTDYLNISGNVLYGLKKDKDISQYNTLYIPSNINKVNVDAFKNAFNYKSSIKTIKFASGVRAVEAQAFEGCSGITKLDFSEFTEEDIKYFSVDGFLFEYDIRNMWQGSVVLPNVSEKSITLLKNKLIKSKVPESWFVQESTGHIKVEETEPKEKEVVGDSTIVLNNITLINEKTSKQVITAVASVVDASEGVSVVLGTPIVEGKTASVPAEMVNATKTGDYVTYKITLVCTEYGTTNANTENKTVVWTETVETFKLTYITSEVKHIESIEFTKDRLVLCNNASATLEVTISPQDVVDPSITWSTEPASQDIISIDAEGKVTALKPGSVTVVATANDKTEGTITASCKVTVQSEGMLYFEKTSEDTAAVYCGWDLYTATEDQVIDIPATTTDEDGKTLYVTEIGEDGFEGLEHLTGVQFNDAANYYIKKIGKNAFKGCTNLTSIDLGVLAYSDDTDYSTLTTIEDSAFEGCSSLTEVNLINEDDDDSTIETIGKNAFKDCKALESIIIGSLTSTIGAGAFEGCEVLEDVEFIKPLLPDEYSYLPNNFEYYYGWDVQDDDLLRYVPSDDGEINAIALTTTYKDKDWKLDKKFIYNFAFQSTSGLTADDSICISSIHLGDDMPEEVIVPSKAIKDGKTLTIRAINYITSFIDYYNFGVIDINYPFNYTKKIDLSNTDIEYIDDEAFAFSNYLEEIKLNNKIKSIGSRAFWCTNLKTINIPASCTSIGAGAFATDGGFTSITFNNGQFKYENGFILENTGTNYDKLICYCGSATEVEIPTTVKTIEPYAFAYNQNITKVIIPQNVETIGQDTFYGCRYLEELDFDKNCKVKELPKEMCMECQSLATYNIPNNVEIIGQSCFQGASCSNDVDKFDLIIPKSVKTISDFAFAPMYINETFTKVRMWDWQKPKLGALTFETEDETGDSNLQTIGNYAFFNCPISKQIVFPKSLVTIGNHAFEATDSHEFTTSIEFNDYQNSKLEVIGDYAFANASLNDNLYFPLGLKKIGDYAFKDNNFLDLKFGPNTQVTSTSFLTSNASASKNLFVGDNGNIYLKGKVWAYDEGYKQWLYKPCEYALIQAHIQNHAVVIASTTIADMSELPCRSIASKLLLDEESIKERATEAQTSYSALRTTIVIPDNIQFICDYAFDQFNLFQTMSASSFDDLTVILNYGNNLEFIGDYAFANHKVYFDSPGIPFESTSNNNAEPATLFDKLKYIGDYAFAKTSFASFGSSWLESMNQLNIQIPKTIEHIGKFAFKWNELTEPVSLPTDKENLDLEPGWLSDCVYSVDLSTANDLYDADPHNVIYKLKDGKRDEAVAAPLLNYSEGNPYILDSYDVDASVSKIDDYAFHTIQWTKQIVLPGSVTEIGDHAFALDPMLMQNDDNFVLSSVTFSAKPTSLKIGKYAFSLLHSLENFVAPDTLTEIGEYAFMYTSIKGFNVPEGVTELNNVFAGCGSLQNLTLPSTLEKISMLDFGCCEEGINIKYNGSASDYVKITKAACSKRNLDDQEALISNWILQTTPENPGNPDSFKIAMINFVYTLYKYDVIPVLKMEMVEMLFQLSAATSLTQQVICNDGSVSVTSIDHNSTKSIKETKLLYNFASWVTYVWLFGLNF